ncbi:MAG: peptidylprolyl isomerase [Nanoarchaeota archaeon]
MAKNVKKHPIKKKESSSKRHVHRKKEPRSNVFMITLIIALVVGGVYFAYRDSPELFEPITSIFEDKGPVAATVNGERIYVSEVEEQYQQIPQQLKQGMTKSLVLDQIITQEVLVQEAQDEGIRVTDDELDTFVDNAVERSGWTREEFEKVLEAQDLTFENLKDLYRVSLVIEKLINQTVLGNIQVTDEEVRSFYENNTEEFTVKEEQVRVQHILISNESVNDTAARELAEDLRYRAVNGANFSKLALNYSDDPSAATNLGDLGFFGRGRMVAAFEEMAFRLENEGDLSEVVGTQFGYHILKLIDSREAGDVIPFEDVRDQIRQDILSQKQAVAVEEYIREQRADAAIEFMNSSIRNASANPVAAPVAEDDMQAAMAQ